MFKNKPTGPKDAISEPNSQVVPTREQAYEHVPGTTHLNAFIADVEEAKKVFNEAKSALAIAKQRLYQKKLESGMIKE